MDAWEQKENGKAATLCALLPELNEIAWSQMEKDRSNLKMAVARLKEIENKSKKLNDQMVDLENMLQKWLMDNLKVAFAVEVTVLDCSTLSNMSSFEGKTAIVTGGCSGIGYATIEHFLKQNIKNVAILDLADPKNVTQSLQSSYPNPNVVFIKTDVTKKEQVKNAFDEVITKFSFVDIVVANAGILKESDYEMTINIGLSHTVYTGIDVMNKDKGRGGVIVSIASVAGLDGFYSMPMYSATKHGVIGLNRCLGTDFFFSKYGIKFLTVCPGFTDTAILDDLGNRLSEGTLDATLQVKAILPFQTADSVGRCITEISSSGNNGSVWIVDDGKTREVTLNKYFLGA